MACLSVCKTTEPIEMRFALRTWMGPKNHVLDTDSAADLRCIGDILTEKVRPMTFCRELCKKRLNRVRCRGLGCMGSLKHVLDGVYIGLAPPGEYD